MQKEADIEGGGHGVGVGEEFAGAGAELLAVGVVGSQCRREKRREESTRATRWPILRLKRGETAEPE